MESNDQIMSRKGGPFLFVNFYNFHISSRKIITQECGI